MKDQNFLQKKNHRIIKSYPCLKKGHLQQVAQDHIWLDFKYPQRWKLRSLSGQALPAFDHAHNKKQFFLQLIGISCITGNSCICDSPMEKGM